MSVYQDFNETQQFACRVIADHARSTAFAIADGILPGNEGRNYVLRKIMRRAIYHGREHLGLNDLFFYKVCDFVVGQMHGAYPELETQREIIDKIVRLEEARFSSTMAEGLKRLRELMDKNARRLAAIPGVKFPLWVSSTQLAKLKDTYGLPVDLMYVVLSTSDLEVKQKYPTLQQYDWQLWVSENTPDGVDLYLREFSDLTPTVVEAILAADLKPSQIEGLTESDFRMIVDDSVTKIQSESGIGKTERKNSISPIYDAVLKRIGANAFYGYDATNLEEAKVVAILDDEKEIEELSFGSTGSIVLDRTPFYAESGGQVGDKGILTGLDKNALVSDAYSPVPGLIVHKVQVRVGSFRVGDIVRAEVDVFSRDATRRNHTATHLVHAALKEVLGTHVKQAGSVVAPSYLRFDFTHYQPMNAAEIAHAEDLVNHYVLQNEPVTTNLMALEEAMSSGAVAMFGEKYGGEVRVLSVGEGVFSKELCGGTHVRATGDIGSFKILSDEAIASGVRRIRAITGLDAFKRFREDEKLIDASLGALNTQRDNLPNAIARLQEELKKTRKEMDELKLKIATGAVGDASSGGDEPREINGVKVLAKIVEGLDGGGTRQLSDTLLARIKSGVVIIGRSEEGKVGIIVRVSDDLTSRVKAGDIIREIAPIVGGRGGGKPDMAEGGGTEPAKLSEAIDAAYGVIERMLG